MNRKSKALLWTVIGLVCLWAILSETGILIPFGEKGRVIRELAAALREYYTIPDSAEKMAELVKRNYSSGKYSMDITRELLWKSINDDLHSVCDDEHLLFVSSPQLVEYARNMINNMDTYSEADSIASEEDHQGIVEAKMIDSQIGYLKLDRFADTLYGKTLLLNTLDTFKNATKMIIDLCDNNGGYFEQAQILYSYFTPPDDSSLIDVCYYRYNDSTQEFWTLKGIGGKPFKREDVCILTSGMTFSAAEGFAYDMKTHGKAIIVGETTRGGGHPVQWKILADHYVLRVPVGRGINPVTGADIEGKGVMPDVAVSRGEALDEALKILRGGQNTGNSSD